MAKLSDDPRVGGGGTVNQRLQSLAIRHGVSIERMKSSEVAALFALLSAADEELLERIVARLVRLGPLEKQRFGFGRATTERALSLRDEIAKIADRSFEVLLGELTSTLLDIGKAEFEFQAGAIAATVTVRAEWVSPSNSVLKTLIRARPFSGEPGSSRLLSEYAKTWSVGRRDAVTGIIRNAIILGETIPQTTQRVRNVLETSKSGAERIARTAIAHITNAVRQETYAANADVLKGLKWSATLDSRTCVICAGLDGKVFPVLSGPRPPAHFSCFPGDTLVTPCGEIAGAAKRPFEGYFIVIRTAAGREVACTPNHLIGTRRGWVAAKDIHAGDEVIGDGGSDRMRLIYDKRDDRKARIHDVAEAFGRSRGVAAREVPTAAPDFHGDGVDGEIGVVWSYSSLLTESDAPALGHVKDFAFFRRNVVLSLLARFGYAATLFVRSLAAFNCDVRGGGQSLALFRGGAVHSGLLLFAGVPQAHPAFAQHRFDLRPNQAKAVCDACGPDATEVEGNDLVAFGSRFLKFKPVNALRADRAERNAAFFEDTVDGLAADAELFTDRLGRLAGEVEFDNVVSVRIKEGVSSHVYNLQTEKNVYFAGGILAHNCRCVMIPVTKATIGIPIGKRSSSDGEVPGDLTFGDWLKTQTKDVQEDVLGVTGRKLWLAGKLPLDGFVDRSGRRFTLDELRARNRAAFRRAGV